MKLVRSDSPEVARSIASTGALACWGWSALSALTLACVASVPGLLIGLAISLIFSVRAGLWLGVPLILASNIYLLWRGMSPRLNWVVAGCADRVYVRLFVRRRRGRGNVGEPEIMVLEASEIASMSVQAVEVFLYGPKPRIVERLVIEPAQAAAEAVSDHVRPLLRPIQACALDPEDLRKQFFAANEEGRLVMDWKYCRPALGVFLQQVSRECPSVVITPKERSELDLNGIWHGISLNLDAQKRNLLVQAHRLGFDCVWLLCRYKYISRRKAAAYLAEIEQEEAEPDRSTVQP